jgi:hypothetical protein
MTDCLIASELFRIVFLLKQFQVVILKIRVVPLCFLFFLLNNNSSVHPLPALAADPLLGDMDCLSYSCYLIPATQYPILANCWNLSPCHGKTTTREKLDGYDKIVPTL